MAGNIDFIMLERQIGQEAVLKIRAGFKSAIRNAVNVEGASKKASVVSKYKDGRLDRLTFIAPDYIYKQNFGFEGDKSNGVRMRLKATQVIQKALQDSNALNDLAEKLADLRGTEILTKINFEK